ncbi:hypothetical protein F5884DRAFT_798241 [Xylogone sp. PMI_703]|nr:hypothetical protein F5884DRAFT_798241 [Xylogone sp. PMI_703]
MSGLEVLSALGVAASISQLIDYSFMVIRAISEVYCRVKDAPQRIAQYSAQIHEILEAVNVIKAQELKSRHVYNQLEHTLTEVKRLLKLLDRVRQDYTTGSGGRRLWKVVVGNKEKRIVACFENLERAKVALILCINIDQSRVLNDIGNSVGMLIENAPHYCMTPPQTVETYQDEHYTLATDTPPLTLIEAPNKVSGSLDSQYPVETQQGTGYQTETQSFKDSESCGSSWQFNGDFGIDATSNIYDGQVSRDESCQINGSVGKSATHRHINAKSTGSSIQINGNIQQGFTVDDICYIFGKPK